MLKVEFIKYTLNLPYLSYNFGTTILIKVCPMKYAMPKKPISKWEAQSRSKELIKLCKLCVSFQSTLYDTTAPSAPHTSC